MNVDIMSRAVVHTCARVVRTRSRDVVRTRSVAQTRSAAAHRG